MKTIESNNTFELTPYHSVRAWIDQWPDAAMPDHIVRETHLSATETATILTRSLVIETRRIVGPRAEYALLGASLSSGLTPDKFTIRAYESASGLRSRLTWAMGDQHDPVSVGLLQEYLPAILKAAAEVSVSQSFGGCLLCFSFGASAEAGSSPRVFGRLSRCLTQVILSQQWPPDEDELLTLLKTL